MDCPHCNKENNDGKIENNYQALVGALKLAIDAPGDEHQLRAVALAEEFAAHSELKSNDQEEEIKRRTTMSNVEMSKGLRDRLWKFFHFSYHHYSIRDLLVAIKRKPCRLEQRRRHKGHW